MDRTGGVDGLDDGKTSGIYTGVSPDLGARRY